MSFLKNNLLPHEQLSLKEHNVEFNNWVFNVRSFALICKI